MFIFVVIITTIVVLLFTSSGQSVRDFWGRYKFSKTLGGPAFYSIIGNVTEEEALSWVVDMSQKYGSVFRVWFGEQLTLFVSDAEYLKIVLSSNELIDKSMDYLMLEPWLGRGLLTNGGSSWHQQRKLLTPSFHFNILGTFRTPMEECCSVLIDKLSEVADGVTSVDIYPYVSLFSLDVICETAMGVKTHSQLNSDSDYVKATKTVCQITIEQMFSIWQSNPVLFYLSSNGRKRRPALQVLHDQTKRVIQTRRAEMMSESQFDSTHSEMDDIDSLLRAQMDGVAITDKQIEDEVNTFMFEGHDTTSSAISFAIYSLSQHDDFQRRARDEVLASSDLDATPFLEAFIKETLRLYPAVPYYSRNVVKPFQMGPYLIPPTVTVAVLAYQVHRDPTLYPDPEVFNPDRFLTGVSAHPYSHVAFSAGPRNCIGQRFAMLELKCTLANILRAFDILPVDGFKPSLAARLVLGSTNGVQVRLRRRE